MTATRGALRRYPALGFLVAAGLLATLLPSSLRLPLAGPSSVAEVAPVPGDGQAAGDLSELGLGQSGGLGFGSGAGGAFDATTTTTATEGSDGGRGTRRSPRGKRCVGSPARQTEDPLSPPCVAHFDGDNGGATTKGVTADEITVVIVWGVADNPSWVDYDRADSGSSAVQHVIGRAYQRYFNDRFQMYGRRVHLWGYSVRAVEGNATVAELRAAAVEIDAARNPFAVVSLLLQGASTFADALARRDILVDSLGGFPRSQYQSLAPFLLSVAPDLEDQAAIVSSYVCSRLVPGPARFSGNATDRSTERSFGVVYDDNAANPVYGQFVERLAASLAATCGVSFRATATVSSATAASTQTYATALAALRTEGVTTVVASGTNAITFSNALAGMQWYPEIVVPGRQDLLGSDGTTTGRVAHPVVWQQAFGVTFDVRRGPVAEQPWHQAFKEACPECQVTSHYFYNWAYESLFLLAYGIQVAGPRLNASSLDRGLHAVEARPSTSPYAPAAYFAPGNYSFVKDGMEIWWSASESPPNDDRPGCYRLPRDGGRARAGEWPTGSQGLFSDGPCQGASQL